MIRAVELGIRSASKKAFSFNVWEREEVVFIKLVDVQNCMPDLFDVDIAGKGRLLTAISFRTYAMFIIPEVTSCDRRMVAHLFRDHLGCCCAISP